jgi:hypothetical protein
MGSHASTQQKMDCAPDPLAATKGVRAMSDLSLNTAERPLLPRIPVKRRSPVVNAFLEPIRAGVTDPQAIIDAAITILRQQISYHAQSTGTSVNPDLQATVLAVIGHPSEARALAVDLLAYHALPREERERLKTARQAQSRQESMSSLPPTDKQLSYLRALGVTTMPANRWDASQLLDARIRKGGAH